MTVQPMVQLGIWLLWLLWHRGINRLNSSSSRPHHHPRSHWLDLNPCNISSHYDVQLSAHGQQRQYSSY